MKNTLLNQNIAVIIFGTEGVWCFYLAPTESVKLWEKIREETSCHSFPFVCLGASGLSCRSQTSLRANCKSGRIRKLSSGGQMELPRWLWGLQWPWVLLQPPPRMWGSVRDIRLSPWWLSWTLHASLTSNLTPPTTMKQLFKTWGFLCQRLRCLSVLEFTPSQLACGALQRPFPS